MTHKFKIGDRVRLISVPPKNRNEGPTWHENMDDLCGQEGTICHITSLGNYQLKGIRTQPGSVLLYTFLEKWLIPLEPDINWHDDPIIRKIKELDNKFKQRKEGTQNLYCRSQTSWNRYL